MKYAEERGTQVIGRESKRTKMMPLTNNTHLLDGEGFLAAATSDTLPSPVLAAIFIGNFPVSVSGLQQGHAKRIVLRYYSQSHYVLRTKSIRSVPCQSQHFLF